MSDDDALKPASARILTAIPEAGAVPRLVTTKSDREIAEDLKARFAVVLEPVAMLIREANAAEFLVNFDFARDHFGRLKIEAQLAKRF